PGDRERRFGPDPERDLRAQPAQQIERLVRERIGFVIVTGLGEDIDDLPPRSIARGRIVERLREHRRELVIEPHPREPPSSGPAPAVAPLPRPSRPRRGKSDSAVRYKVGQLPASERIL